MAPTCRFKVGQAIQTTDSAVQEALLGLGNVIIGYNESDGTDLRSGSHNLIVGSNHSYTGDCGYSVRSERDRLRAIMPLVWAVKTTSSPVTTPALPVDSMAPWLETMVHLGRIPKSSQCVLL